VAKKKIVTIVGTGVIGAGWAARFIASGYYVQAYDPKEKSLIKLKIDVKKALQSLKKIGLHKNASLKNLSCFSNLTESLKDTTFVQENAPENEKIKKELLKKLIT
jgi:carnitine 3-dehydrogenase